MSSYITLLRDSSRSKRLDNSLFHYITDLARAVDLDGHWVVGLSKIIIAHWVISMPQISMIECYNNDTQEHLNESTQVFHSFSIFPNLKGEVHLEILELMNQCMNLPSALTLLHLM